MKLLTATAILAADDLDRSEVDVPEWGGAVTVRALSLGERLAFAALAQAEPEKASAWLVVVAAIDPKTGEQLFDPAELDANVKAMMGKASDPVSRLSDAVLKLSGWGIDEAQAEGN